MAEAVAFAILVAVVVAAGERDIRTGLIPNRLTYTAMAGGLMFWLVAGWATGGMEGAMARLGDSGLALAAGLVPFAMLFLFAHALGGGDAKLMGAVGAWCAEWRCVVDTALLSFVFALLFAVVLMIRGRVVKATLGRVFGALLHLAARVPPDLPSDSPRVPFGVAIGCGAILAGMKWMLHWPVPLADWGM